MTEKNARKADLKKRRKPPMPAPKMTPTKTEKVRRNEKKHRRSEE